MLTEMERKVVETLAKVGPLRNEVQLLDAFLEVRERHGNVYYDASTYSGFTRFLRRLERKLQRALDDLELLRKTGLFDPDGRLLFAPERLFDRVRATSFLLQVTVERMVVDREARRAVKLRVAASSGRGGLADE